MIKKFKDIRYNGFNILRESWDICLILDACRYDLFMSVADDYDFITHVEKRWSIASESKAWMNRTFRFEDCSDIIYICGNPLLEDTKVKLSKFHRVIQPWKTQWDSDVGTIRSEELTDILIDNMDKISEKRIIVHYMQPHYPFISDIVNSPKMSAGPIKHDEDYNIWDLLKNGKYTENEIWQGYQDNLRYVLDDIERIEFTGEICITSDHANAMGEHGVYGHPKQSNNPFVREVPYCKINTIHGMLRDLGYL